MGDGWEGDRQRERGRGGWLFLNREGIGPSWAQRILRVSQPTGDIHSFIWGLGGALAPSAID